MYRQKISNKNSSPVKSTAINDVAPNQSYGSLSSVIQRAQQDVNTLSGDERQQLESAIGTKATGEVLTGKQWVPEFQGISGQLWGDAAIQAKRKDDNSVSEVQPENKTGLPDKLKTGIENLSGIAMDDVKVYYNSSKPSGLGALAYTQGTDIHVAPRQEKHLPHEAWHVVQQMQRRVKPTMQMKDKVNVNDDNGLEKEADVMGRVALKNGQNNSNLGSGGSQNLIHKLPQLNGLIQRITGVDPLPSYARGGDPSLLYGLTPLRKLTYDRLKTQDATMAAPQPIRTTDNYNEAVGINETMKPQSAMGLFKIREALEDANPARNWSTYFRSKATVVAADWRLQAWITMLATDKQRIGLYDFGDRTKVGQYGFRKRAGFNKINSKDRFQKNLKPQHNLNLKPKEINSFLREQTFSSASKMYMAMPALKKAALDKWVYQAFFRRTSKLGMKFAISLGGKINFNIAGAIDPNSSDTYISSLRDDGLVLNSQFMNQDQDRSITISEWRHIQRELGKGSILPASVNFYGEY